MFNYLDWYLALAGAFLLGWLACSLMVMAAEHRPRSRNLEGIEDWGRVKDWDRRPRTRPGRWGEEDEG